MRGRKREVLMEGNGIKEERGGEQRDKAEKRREKRETTISDDRLNAAVHTPEKVVHDISHTQLLLL